MAMSRAQENVELRPLHTFSLPEIANDFARRIVPRHPGYATPRVRSRSAHIKPRKRTAVISVAEHRARAVQLVERERTVENIAARETEFALEIERRQYHAPEYA